jgi:cell division protein ZapB
LNYSARVEAELKSLESKIERFIELYQRLRADNQELRQQLASAISHGRRLEEKINAASSRLETLLTHIPAEDDA